MAVNQHLANQVREQLQRQLDPEIFFDEVVEKKMFGGLTFLVRGKMCVCVNANRVMVRIGKEHHDRLSLLDGVTTTVMGNRCYKGYLDLGAAALPQLDFWVAQALTYNLQLTQ